MNSLLKITFLQRLYLTFFLFFALSTIGCSSKKINSSDKALLQWMPAKTFAILVGSPKTSDLIAQFSQIENSQSSTIAPQLQSFLTQTNRIVIGYGPKESILFFLGNFEENQVQQLIEKAVELANLQFKRTTLTFSEKHTLPNKKTQSQKTNDLISNIGSAEKHFSVNHETFQEKPIYVLKPSNFGIALLSQNQLAMGDLNHLKRILTRSQTTTLDPSLLKLYRHRPEDKILWAGITPPDFFKRWKQIGSKNKKQPKRPEFISATFEMSRGPLIQAEAQLNFKNANPDWSSSFNLRKHYAEAEVLKHIPQLAPAFESLKFSQHKNKVSISFQIQEHLLVEALKDFYKKLSEKTLLKPATTNLRKPSKGTPIK